MESDFTEDLKPASPKPPISLWTYDAQVQGEQTEEAASPALPLRSPVAQWVATNGHCSKTPSNESSPGTDHAFSNDLRQNDIDTKDQLLDPRAFNDLRQNDSDTKDQLLDPHAFSNDLRQNDSDTKDRLLVPFESDPFDLRAYLMSIDPLPQFYSQEGSEPVIFPDPPRLKRSIPRLVKNFGNKVAKIKRGLPGLIDGDRTSALADTGTAKNVISAAFAEEKGLVLEAKAAEFKLGNSERVRSIGKMKQAVMIFAVLLSYR